MSVFSTLFVIFSMKLQLILTFQNVWIMVLELWCVGQLFLKLSNPNFWALTNLNIFSEYNNYVFDMAAKVIISKYLLSYSK